MKRIVASLWVCWAAYCGFESNTVPLAFGMTPREASAALGVRWSITPDGQARKSISPTDRRAFPGFYPVDFALALQFRKGHLTGWKKDWQLRRPWPF